MRRRDFLRMAAAAAAGTSLPTVLGGCMQPVRRPGPNDRIRVAFIGAGGRGRHLMMGENLAEHADLVAICDCYRKRIDETMAKLPHADKVHTYHDYREMLDKEKLDAVYVTTTTHARALICIHAMQAGLDVYAEKPVCLTIAESRSLVRAARKLRRVFQVGTQQRSIPSNVFASRLVREGAIGKVKEVIACNFLPPERWRPKPVQAIPEGLNWDAWCAQTELRPYHPELQFSWARWWDYDGGGVSWGVTGWGTHALDQVQCALGTDDTGPVEIWPDEPGPHGKVTMRYKNGVLLKLHGPKRDLADLGAIFIGDKGQIEIKRGSFTSDRPELLRDQPTTLPANVPGECKWHFDNFFECMRTGKRPNADIEIAHRATTVCYLVNICRDLGRKLHWDPKAERFVGDDEANRMLSRPRRKGYELPQEYA